MGLMDKAKQALKGRSQSVEKGIDKAVAAADKRTKGKYGDKLSSGAQTIKERARKLDTERSADTGTGAAGTTDPANQPGPVGDVEPPGAGPTASGGPPR